MLNFDDGTQQRDSVCVCMPNHIDGDNSRLLARASQQTLMFGSKQNASGALPLDLQEL